MHPQSSHWLRPPPPPPQGDEAEEVARRAIEDLPAAKVAEEVSRSRRTKTAEGAAGDISTAGLPASQGQTTSTNSLSY